MQVFLLERLGRDVEHLGLVVIDEDGYVSGHGCSRNMSTRESVSTEGGRAAAALFELAQRSVVEEVAFELAFPGHAEAAGVGRELPGEDVEHDLGAREQSHAHRANIGLALVLP